MLLSSRARRLRVSPVTVLALVTGCALAAGCTDTRQERLKRETEYMKANQAPKPEDAPPDIPPDPMRDSMAGFLAKLYSGERLPDVYEEELVVEDGRFPYQLKAGILSAIKLQKGMPAAERARAIVVATAEADAWVHRGTARRDYAEHVQRIKNSFGEEQKQLIMRAYAELKLLDFFNSDAGIAAMNELPADIKPAIESLRAEYVDNNKQAVWDRWMAVKMYARREVGGDEPFKSILKRAREQFGQAEPPPIAWKDAHEGPLAAWAAEIEKDDDLLAIMTNLPELRDREEFKGDTHALWLMEGSSKIPAKAKGAKVDEELGFAVHREDLGGGYQEMIFIFPKKLSGDALKRVYLRSLIYRHLFSDFQMLATSGTDFEGEVVPDKFDPEYARCGSLMAIDALIEGKGAKRPLINTLTPINRGEEAQLNAAHKCIIERCTPEIRIPAKDDETDVQGPAPNSRLAFFQMVTRFQEIDLDMNAMRKEREKSQDVQDAEAFLKANKNKPL